MASQQNFTQIASIPELIIHIYKFLDFEDQLRLSRVDSQLKLMFKSFIWREEYSTLKVYKNPPYFVVTNEKCENRLCLNSTAYREFLRFYANEVLQLTLHNPKKEDKPTDRDVHLNYFQNLLSFNCEHGTISLADVKVIAERNANLQELKLKSYSNEKEYVTDEVIECIIQKMVNLKRLHIETYPKIDIELSKIQAILCETKLQNLELTGVIGCDKGIKDFKYFETMTSKLNVFNLHTTFDPRKWPSNCESYFRNLKSLTALTIKMDCNVTDEILSIIAETCNCLKTLRFELTQFHDIKLFPVPSSVVEFSLRYCYGLTQDNLKRILNQYNIIKFYSSYTGYRGEFEDFPISPLIETLRISEAFHTLEHESSYKAINNLRELLWYHSFPIHITPSFSLKNCINLHTLDLIHCQIDLAALLELKSLRKLVMYYLGDLIKLSFIAQLLEKHSSLKEFIIKKLYATGYREMQLPLPYKEITTQVHSIEIPFDIVTLGLDFWMDLFSTNKRMRLQIIFAYQPS